MISVVMLGEGVKNRDIAYPYLVAWVESDKWELLSC